MAFVGSVHGAPAPAISMSAWRTESSSSWRMSGLLCTDIRRAASTKSIIDSCGAVGVPSAASLEVLCEWLAEHYLEAGETLASQPGRDRAQALAGMAIRRLALIRHLEAARG